jgi:ankyrin repeat protein
MKLPYELIDIIISLTGNHKLVGPFYNILSKCSKKTLFKNISFMDLSDSDILLYKILLTVNDPSVENNWAIIIAAGNSHTEVVKLLLQDSRVDPSVENNEAIITASMDGNYEIVKLLLQDSRVSSSAAINDALLFATDKGHHDIVKLLKT